MAQFDFYRNPDAASRRRVPFLLDIQSELLEPLATRVVVPLRALDAAEALRMNRLMPVFDVEGRRVVMDTPQLAGVQRQAIGERVGSLVPARHEIVAALDMLISGV